MLKASWHPPLFGLLQCVPLPLLLQPPPSLLKLGEGVWSGVGGHSRVLDERVGGLDLGGCWTGDGRRHRGGVVAQLGRDPGVHSSGSLHRSGTRWLGAGCGPPGAAGAATGKQTGRELRWDGKNPYISVDLDLRAKAFQTILLSYRVHCIQHSDRK